MTCVSETLTCQVFGLPSTEAIYNKREADAHRAELQREHGGSWSTEQIGRKWRVRQDVTKEQIKTASRRRKAEFTLSDHCDWFSSASVLFSVYKTRNELKAKLYKFQADFAANPVYALQDSVAMFQTAAEYQIVEQLIDRHERGTNAEKICAHLESEADRMICCDRIDGSTSPTRNLMDNAMRIATIKYARAMREWLTQRAQAVGDLYDL